MITYVLKLQVYKFITGHKLSQKAIRSVSGRSIKVFVTLKLMHFSVAFPGATGNHPGVNAVTGLPVVENCVQTSTYVGKIQSN